MASEARSAAGFLSSVSGEMKNRALVSIAEALITNAGAILAENKKDLELAEGNIKPSMLDRLRLTSERIEAISASVKKVVALPDPTGLSDGWTRPNGLKIERRRVGLGVVAIICESRPNVTADASVLCLKASDAVILRGGKEALNTNRMIVSTIRTALEQCGFPRGCVQLIDSADREYTLKLLRMSGQIDLAIPRGGAGLINFVKENSRVPVIETGAGNCHIYVHEDADQEKAINILINAKTQRPSVCNSAEGLVVHSSIAASFLPKAAEALQQKGVEIRADGRACTFINDPKIVKATEEDFYTEYDDLIISVKVVDSLQEAIGFINEHNTKHSEAIITESLSASDEFSAKIDAACVYTNASTRFTDGEEFGFGAEIGISTGKLHARGPMGLNELTCVKYVITGNGQIRK